MAEPGTQATGDCYKDAFVFFTLHAEVEPDRYVLVHGNVAPLSQDRAVNHAWVEEGDVVHDFSKGRHTEVRKTDYYSHFGVKNVRRYEYEDALLACLRAKHYGPWDDDLQARDL